jgi:hypothetical protein
MNGQPAGFVKFINQLQMASFGSFIGEVRWTLISVLIGGVDAWLLTRESEAMRATGLAVLGILVGSLVTKTVASVVSNKNVRDSSREAFEGRALVAEATERGKAAGNADASRAADQRVREAITAEHDSPQLRTTVKAKNPDEVTVTAGAEPDGAE